MPSADVIILPVLDTKAETRVPAGVDLGQQQLLPSSDRRKVVDLLQVKVAREMARVSEGGKDV
jgi:hypothetical protein